MEDYLIALREYGLTENEIKVFITSLKLGVSTAQKIAKYSELPRTTTYHLLENLIQKNLISKIIKEQKQHFQAISPEKMLTSLEEKKKIISEAIPFLKSLTTTMTEKPAVEVYEGLRGIKYVLQEILNERKVIYHYGDIISLQNVLPYAFPQFINQRVKKKIQIKVMCKKEKLHDELIRTSKKEYREFAFIPEKLAFHSSVFIYLDRVAIFNLKREPCYVIVIKSKDYYETEKNMFLLLWKTAKINPPKIPQKGQKGK